MRKLKLQVQMTLDGFIAGINGEMDWITWNWDEELKNYVIELTETIDCILLGRVLAQGFIPHWSAKAANLETAEFFDHKMNDTPKVVFSKTLETIEWENTILASGDFVEEITNLKQQNGKDMIVYGGANFVANLIRFNLIDEYHLFVNPTAIGNGMSIFKNLEEKLKLNLVKSTAFECGIVVLCYKSNVS
jgi:dihydrofolate reductase